MAIAMATETDQSITLQGLVVCMDNEVSVFSKRLYKAARQITSSHQEWRGQGEIAQSMNQNGDHTGATFQHPVTLA